MSNKAKQIAMHDMAEEGLSLAEAIVDTINKVLEVQNNHQPF